MAKFVVAQSGARRGYAVPALLAQAGLLERFYTDLCASVGLGRYLSGLRHVPGLGSTLGRLAHRRLPPELVPLTYSLGLTDLWAAVRRESSSQPPVEAFVSDLRRSRALGRAAAKAGLGQGTHLYTMHIEFPDLIVHAKRKGLTTVSEAYIAPSTERILEEEAASFPEWVDPPVSFGDLRERLLPSEIRQSIDYYICPSPFVRDDLIRTLGVSADRTLLVPYGVSKAWLDRTNEPVPGRVLFAGSATLRKGIHRLAELATALSHDGTRYDFRVAGDVSARVRQAACGSPVTFLGRVPRAEIGSEFARADVFVLPTLAEGSAEVIYEALAVGLPVVTTPAAGSVVRDGVDGFVVPVGDVKGLATAVRAIVENRELRTSMSSAARLRAAEYTWEEYGRRLLDALASVGQSVALSQRHAG